MNDVIKKIEKTKIIPVVVIDDAGKAGRLAQALIKGGIRCAEITFRTAAAKEAISIMTRENPNMLIGAGTVLTKEQVDEAVSAGAGFIVSPGLNPEIVKYCQNRNITIIPGVMTPTEIEAAMALSLDVVKFFPAEAAGGLKMIKAISAPYGSVRFLPTGGINASNVGDYLNDPHVIACGGSWMVSRELIDSSDFEEITRRTAEAVSMLGQEPVKQ